MSVATGVLVLSVILTGWGSHYGPNVMERNIAIRQDGRTAYDLPLNITGYDGYVAVLDCSWIGRTVYIKPVKGGKWERYLVSDCAGVADGGAAWMRRNNVIVEFDYKSAARLETIGHGLPIMMAIMIRRRFDLI